jgi:hypothetical protein
VPGPTRSNSPEAGPRHCLLALTSLLGVMSSPTSTTLPTISRAVRAVVLCALLSLSMALTLEAQPVSTGAGRSRPGDTAGGPGAGPVAPRFLSHPVDVRTAAFADASFSVSYMGRPQPSVSWQFSADGANWNDVPGANTQVLLVRYPVVAHNGTQWRARLTTPGHAPLFSNSATLTVDKAAAAIIVEGLEHAFDGTPKAVDVRTVPPALPTTVTYALDGISVAAPSEPGTYAVTVVANGPNHTGTASATMVITKQEIR